MAGWFSGVAPECTAPQAGKVAVETLDSNLPDGTSPRDSDPNNSREQEQALLNANAPVPESIPADIRMAIQRTQAMCKAMIQASEASFRKRLDDLDKEASHLSSGRPAPLSSPTTVTPPAIADGKTSYGFDVEEGSALTTFKDDVQTVIDAMRLELQRQKAIVANLEEQVRTGVAPAPGAAPAAAAPALGRKSFMEAMADNLFGSSSQQAVKEERAPIASDQFVTLQRLDERVGEIQAALKEDIMSSQLALGKVEDGGEKLSKAAFDTFSEAVTRQFDDVQKGLVELKNSQELVAVKAGFLAVAATECNHEEKDNLFKSLKEQEELCHRNGVFTDNKRFTGC